MAKFCTSCGNELHDEAVICPKCGISQETKVQEQKSSTNGIAIAGFVCSFFFALVGLILSIVGLKKSKQTNSGRGLAIAGIIISSVSMLLSLIIVIFTFYLIGTGVYYYKDNIYDTLEEKYDDYYDDFEDYAEDLEEKANNYIDDEEDIVNEYIEKYKEKVNSYTES